MEAGRIPELREFLKEQKETLYCLCYFLLQDDSEVEDFILSLSRKLGMWYRKEASHTTAHRNPHELSLSFYKFAWQQIHDKAHEFPSIPFSGRDPRNLKKVDADLLEEWQQTTKKQAPWNGLEGALVDRMRMIEPELRAPLVLRDLLQFEDEEVVQILGLRWGVYRHRLHRGRLELVERLRGKASQTSAPKKR